MKNYGVTIYLKSHSQNDLKNILQVIGENGKHSAWKIFDVECLGKSAETLHQISDEEKEISGVEFYKIVSGIYQVLDGTFRAYKPNENNHWILIRFIRGDEIDIETEDKKTLEIICNSFQNVKDLIY